MTKQNENESVIFNTINLYEELCDRLSWLNQDCRDTVNCFIEDMISHTEKYGSVSLKGIGSFNLRIVPDRNLPLPSGGYSFIKEHYTLDFIKLIDCESSTSLISINSKAYKIIIDILKEKDNFRLSNFGKIIDLKEKKRFFLSHTLKDRLRKITL